MLLFDQLQYEQPSLQQHALSLSSDTDLHISKQALDKRFNSNALLFIEKVFKNYLTHRLSWEGIPTKLKNKYAAIRVLIQQNSSSQTQWQKNFLGIVLQML